MVVGVVDVVDLVGLVVAAVTVAVLTGDVAYDGALNVASGEPHTVLDLAVALASATGRADLAPRVVGGGRIGDVRHVVASPQRAIDHLGVTARVPFEEGVAEFAHAPLR